MHKFRISYMNQHSEKCVTTVFAVDEEQALRDLTDISDITSVFDLGKVIQIPRFFNPHKVSSRELAAILRNISYTRRAGLTILDSVKILSTTGSSRQMYLCSSILASLREGASLADAFAHEVHNLPLDISSVIDAGAKAGNLNQILLSLADQLESSVNVNNKIRSALLYPCTILAVAIVVTLFLFISVIPQVANAVQGVSSMSLSPATLTVLSVGQYLSENGFLLFTVIAAVVLLSIFLFNSVLSRHKARLALAIPIIGKIARDGELLCFLEHFSFLLKAGLTSSDAMTAAANVTHNEFIRSKLLVSCQAIVDGQSITNALVNSKLFSPLEIQMITIAEHAGNLSETCSLLSQQLSEQVDRRLQNAIKLLEPAVMIFVGIVVGVIMLVIYQPLFEMMSMV